MAGVTSWREAVLAGGMGLGVDALADIVTGALAEELPVLRGDADLLAGARSSSTAYLVLAVELTAGRLALDDLAPPPQAIAFARELVHRNVAADELGRAYRVAQLAVWEWACHAVRATVAPQDAAAQVEEMTAAVFAGGDRLTTAIMAHYAAERDAWLRGPTALRRATVDALLAGEPVDVAAASRRLGYELRREHEAFVVWSDDATDLEEEAAVAVASERGLVLALPGGVAAGWVPAGHVRADAAHGAHVAVGAPGHGPAGFRTSHHQAMEARRVARLTGAATVAYPDVALLALLTHDPEQAQAFCRARLGSLARRDPVSDRLAETLRAVLQERGSPRRAARRLGVHENTVAKRMRAVHERLGDRPPPTAEVLAALTIRDVLPS